MGEGKIKKGDLVVFICGGPEMIVRDLSGMSDNEIGCFFWSENAGEFRMEYFYESELDITTR